MQVHPGAIEALENRAKTGFVFAALSDNERTFAFCAAQLRFVYELRTGTGDLLAAKDAAASGYKPPAGFERAWAALPVGAENLSMVKVQQLLTSQAVELAGDAVAGVDVNAAEQLKNGKFAIVNLNDEHAALAVNGVHSALHAAPLVEKTTVSQEGGAA